MSVLKVREIKQNLQKKGFVEEPSSRHKKHIYYFFYYKGKKTALYTYVSHGEDEVNDFLISRMAKETKLSNVDFRNLVNCSLSEQDYIDVQIRNGILKHNA